MKIEKSETGYWVEYKAGRSRFVPFGTEFASRIERSLTLDGIDSTLRAFASGTHEKMVVYRDADGKLGIPPDPSMVPADCQIIEISTLAEADKITREMREDLRQKFSEDAMTEFLDQAQADANGNTPRDVLVKLEPRSNYERDMRDEMIRVLDKEESDRNRVSVNTHLHWRES